MLERDTTRRRAPRERVARRALGIAQHQPVRVVAEDDPAVHERGARAAHRLRRPREQHGAARRHDHRLSHDVARVVRRAELPAVQVRGDRARVRDLDPLATVVGDGGGIGHHARDGEVATSRAVRRAASATGGEREEHRARRDVGRAKQREQQHHVTRRRGERGRTEKFLARGSWMPTPKSVSWVVDGEERCAGASARPGEQFSASSASPRDTASVECCGPCLRERVDANSPPPRRRLVPPRRRACRP